MKKKYFRILKITVISLIVLILFLFLGYQYFRVYTPKDSTIGKWLNQEIDKFWQSGGNEKTINLQNFKGRDWDTIVIIYSYAGIEEIKKILPEKSWRVHKAIEVMGYERDGCNLHVLKNQKIIYSDYTANLSSDSLVIRNALPKEIHLKRDTSYPDYHRLTIESFETNLK